MKVIVAVIGIAFLTLIPASASAPVSSGPAAHYDPSYTRGDWHAIYNQQAAWGNAVGPPATYGEYWCAHAAYDVVGARLTVISGGQQFTCVTGDTVQDGHKPNWWSKWGIEGSWDFFNALPNPGYVEVYDGAPQVEVAPPEPEVMTFSETEHVISNGFLAFWISYGGLPIFGYPISDEFDCDLETGERGVCQWFERARFELHPDGAIRLGRLGAEIQGR